MTYTYNEIFSKYSEPKPEDYPRITEEFANKMMKQKEDSSKLETQTATPSEIANAISEVLKNEGAKVMTHSTGTLAKLVSEAIRSNKTRCA